MVKQTVIVLVDATGSMGNYCSSVGSTLQQLFIVLDVLYEGQACVDIIAYEDYCDGHRLCRACDSSDRQQLLNFASNLKAGGGGDTPEAVKTALNKLAERIRQSSEFAADSTVIIHYTDAPPHHDSLTGSNAKNLTGEKKALAKESPGFDWVSICKHFKQLGLPIVTFLPNSGGITPQFMALLGDVVVLPNTDPKTITKYTMGVLLHMMGQPFDAISCVGPTDAPDLANLKTEGSDAFRKHLLQKEGLVKAPRAFQVREGFRKDLRVLSTRFQESEEFRDLVFDALKRLFVPDSVLCLTYNSVLGSIWRLVCKRREDARVQPLCDALSTCCQALTGDNQTQLRTWIDESYNQLEEIAEMILAVPKPLDLGVLVLDVPRGDLPNKDEMRSILHAPTPGVLSKVQGLLTRLLVVKQGELPATKDAPMYLPLALKEKDLFSAISHLILPGMMVSLRPACMLAILAYIGGHAALKPRAQAFLEAWKGNWIPPMEKAEDYPEILNAEFVRLVVRVPEFLTETELALYKHMWRILRVRKAAPVKLPIKIGFTPLVKELTLDSKRLCKGCGYRRSFTIMIGDTCGKCSYDKEDGATQKEPSEDSSHMVECRACQALYAVVSVDRLNVLPKCHDCRNHEVVQSVTCRLCRNRYCAPTESDRVDGFICAACTASPARGLPPREVPFAELAQTNPLLMQSLGLKPESLKPLFERIGLYKLWMGHRAMLECVESQRPDSLTWAGKPVQNVQEVLEALLEQVLHGRLADYCCLCFEERALPALQSACGRCDAHACRSCLQHWYGQLEPGCLYVPAEGLCPFCKQTPKGKTLRPFNRMACRLSGRATLALRADVYYGWCVACFQIKEAMPRECATEPPQLKNWQCADCKEKRFAQQFVDDSASAKKGTKPCPGCKMRTIKLDGCDHITCPCGVHWCWRCGGEFSEDAIYDHMDEAHGGMGVEDDEFSD